MTVEANAPLDLSPLMGRIRDQVTGLRQVAGAADYAAIKSLRSFTPPSAYVLMAAEEAQPTPANKPGPLGAQVLAVTFGVAVVLRNYRDQAGAQMAEELRQFLGGVRQAVRSWTPLAPGARPCTLVRGDVVDYDDSVLLWVDVFKTQRFL